MEGLATVSSPNSTLLFKVEQLKMFPVIRKTVSCQLEVGHFVPHNKPRRGLAYLSHVTDTEHDEGRQGHRSQLCG